MEQRLINATELPWVDKLIVLNKCDGDIVVEIKEHASYVDEDTPTVEAIPIEWLKNKRDKLEKEYHDLFHAYTDEGVNKQVWVLNDLYAFRTVLEYWEKENGRSK